MRRASALVLAALLVARPVWAGHACDAGPPEETAVRQAMTLAEHTAEALDRSGARVVVLARVGQNLSEYHLRYSHLGFAYRDADGRWRIVHKLNDCGTAHAAVYRQGLGEFFLDSMYAYEAAFVVPTPALQAHLLTVVEANARLTQLDTPAYSVVAYPWSTTYQQSNQWALETLAMSEEPAADTRDRAQAWLRLHDYRPTTLHLSPLKRLGARLTSANVAFDDHPFDKRFSDRIETVTVESVFDWLERNGLGTPPRVIR